MSAIRGLFRGGDDIPASNDNTDNNNPNKGLSGFLAGTTNFFNSVQAKKDGLMSDLTNKLGTLTPFNEEPKKKSRNDDDDDNSSASEYGDGGDRPVYAEAGGSEGRRLSLESVDSLPEDEAKKYKAFMNQLVEDIFNESTYIAESKKSTFGMYCKHHTGRSSFAKLADQKKFTNKQVADKTMQRLTDYFNIVLSECNTSEDFRPARLLMNLCFTFYTETVKDGCPILTYLYLSLSHQPIWQSLRFWNAAFFESLGQERAKKPEPTTNDPEKALIEDKEFQENVAFGQLSTFTWNMVALGLNRETVLDFLRRQATVANLSREKCRLIRANVQKWTA